MALPRWAAGFLHPKQAELPRGWHSPAALLGSGTHLGAVPRGSRDHRLLASTVLKGLMQGRDGGRGSEDARWSLLALQESFAAFNFSLLFPLVHPWVRAVAQAGVGLSDSETEAGFLLLCQRSFSGFSCSKMAEEPAPAEGGRHAGPCGTAGTSRPSWDPHPRPGAPLAPSPARAMGQAAASSPWHAAWVGEGVETAPP